MSGYRYIASRNVTDLITLGAATRDARWAQGLTRAALSEKAGARPFVITLERDAGPRAELARVMAVLRALGLTLTLGDAAQPADPKPPVALDELQDRLADDT